MAYDIGPFELVASGTSGARVETASAAATQTAINAAIAARTESAEANAAETAANATASAISESATADAVETAGKTTSAAQSEAAIADEASDAVALNLGSIDESASAGETQSAVNTAVASVSESAIADAAESVGVATSAAITESASAGETSDSALGLIPGSITESASAGETVTAINARVGAITETANAADEQVGANATASAITETAIAGETQTATAGIIYPVSISEGATASDAQIAVVAEGILPVASDAGGGGSAVPSKPKRPPRAQPTGRASVDDLLEVQGLRPTARSKPTTKATIPERTIVSRAVSIQLEIDRQRAQEARELAGRSVLGLMTATQPAAIAPRAEIAEQIQEQESIPEEVALLMMIIADAA